MKSLPTFFAVATFAACSLTIARADTTFEPRAVTVRFADLDVNDTHGAAVLFQRITSAAKIVCQDLGSDRQLARMIVYANCVNKAIGNAVVKLDRPAVTDYAVARGALPGPATIKIASNK
jgi:UrcA family protein